MSVALATDPMGAPSPLLPPPLRPIPLQSATQLIGRLPERVRMRAQVQAGARLAAAAYIDHLNRQEEFEDHLTTVLGPSKVSEFKDRIWKQTQHSPDRPIPTHEAVLQAISELDFRSSISREPAERERPTIPEPRPRPVEPGLPIIALTQKSIARGKSRSTLDLRTLTTKVDITSSASRLSFEDLVQSFDPRNWSKSPFWPEAHRVKLDKRTNTFQEIVTPKIVPEGGWEGFFYEHVEWNWNLSTVSSFRNYLWVKYDVNQGAKTIDLDFSLHSCEGSLLYSLVDRGGVDIDWGHQHTGPTRTGNNAPPPGSPANPWRIETQKNLRFSDLLLRRTPFEGGLGSGQILSYLAPAIVGLWMDDLMEHLDSLAPR